MTTPGGSLLGLAVLVPSVGVLIGLALGGRNAQRVALATLPLGVGVAIAIAQAFVRSGSDVVYLLGGWAPPLGIALRADALSATMLLTVAVVICGIAVYACADFATPAGAKETSIGGDLFSLYTNYLDPHVRDLR